MLGAINFITTILNMRAPGRVYIIGFLVLYLFSLFSYFVLLYVDIIIFSFNIVIEFILYNFILLSAKQPSGLIYIKDSLATETTSSTQIDNVRKDIRSVLVGTLLGDASISKSGRAKYTYRFKQGLPNIKYLTYMYLILKPWLTTGSPSLDKSFDTRTNTTHIGILLLVSTSFYYTLEINMLNSIFYKEINNKRTKVVPLNISSLLTPLALAHWIMDDGHYYNGGIYLNTQSFNMEGLQLLLDALQSNFGITAKLKPVSGSNSQKRIFVPAKFRQTFIDLVLPFMHSSMLYKLGL